MYSSDSHVCVCVSSSVWYGRVAVLCMEATRSQCSQLYGRVAVLRMGAIRSQLYGRVAVLRVGEWQSIVRAGGSDLYGVPRTNFSSSLGLSFIPR